ncbi:hypothetical protein Tco_0121500 [Tanacetum coccineum]
MSTLAEFMIVSDGDNRPPMLEKQLYGSWKSRMELYMQNREHGRMILETFEHGLLIWPTIEENGLPSDVYSLVNHHIVAKDLWERVQLLMQGTSSVNTKFLNSLPPEWSKFVTDVKLVRDLHTTNFDQLHAYLEQHEPHIDSGLAVPVFKQGDDPIDAINKMMSFLQQATIHDGRVIVQPVQGRQSSFAAGTSGTNANISGTGGNNSGSGKVLNEEELEFLADPGVSKAKAILMANLSSYRSDVLSEVLHSENTHNDMLNQSVQEIPYSEQTYLMNYPEYEITSDSNIIPYSQNGSDALTEVHNPDNLTYDLFNQSEQIMTSSEQSNDVSQSETEITSDSNIIPYSQYLSETQQETVQNSNSSAQ